MQARKTMMAIAIATLIPLGAAVAGDNDQYGGKEKSMHGTSFKKLDSNKDGRISQAEAAVDSSIMFSSADTNGDGYLDKDELKAAQRSDSSGATPQSSQSPESSSPTTQPTDPDMQQGTEPSGNPTPDTETPR
jgi:Ca2+-binding EF-hand superfamily protein